MPCVQSRCQGKLADGTPCGKPVAIFHMNDGLKYHDPTAARCASCRQRNARNAKKAAGKVERPHGRQEKRWS